VRVIGRIVAFRDPILASAAWKAGLRDQVIQTPGGGQYLASGYGGFTNFADPVVDRKSTRLNSSHVAISYAVFCLKKKICPTTAATEKSTSVLTMRILPSSNTNSSPLTLSGSVGMFDISTIRPTPFNTPLATITLL